MKTDNQGKFISSEGNVTFSGKLYSGPALTGLNFGQALEYLKDGKKVKRAHWGGYWFLKEGIMIPDGYGFRVMHDLIVACLKDDGGYTTATAYQGDLLAEDWELAE